jgi:hypothetical protein
MAEFKVIDEVVVVYGEDEDGGPLGAEIDKCLVKIKAFVSKNKGQKNEIRLPVEFTFDYSGIGLDVLAVASAKSDWIRLQKCRDFNEEKFREIVASIDGSVIPVSDIDDYIPESEGTRKFEDLPREKQLARIEKMMAKVKPA